MTGNDAVVGMIDALNALSIQYMMVGSYISNAWGVARSTQDADFVIEIHAAGVRELAEKLGAGYDIDPQMSFETVTGTYRHIVRTVARGFKIELFLRRDDPFDVERFRRRMTMSLLGRTVYAATAEDIIINKLRWSRLARRRKDVEDVQNIIAVRAPELDWDYIHTWCDRHGTRAILDEIRHAIPPMT